MRKSLKLLKATVILGFLYSTTALAEFTVMTDEWPAADTRGEKVVHSPSELKQTIAEPVRKNCDRGPYGRLQVNWGEQSVFDITNASTGALQAGRVAKNDTSDTDFGFQIALGYRWPHWRVDIEYLFRRKLGYNVSPALNGVGAIALSSSAKSQAWLLNSYYDFDQVYIFWPYITAGLGMGINETDTVIAGSSVVEERNDFAWNIGVGTRMPLMRNLYADISARYIRLGKQKFKDTGNGLTLKGRHRFVGIGFGVNYLF